MKWPDKQELVIEGGENKKKKWEDWMEEVALHYTRKGSIDPVT